MRSRERKAWATYLGRTIVCMEPDAMWAVRGRKRKGKIGESCIVTKDDEAIFYGNCKGFSKTGACKHIDAVKKFIDKGPPESGYAVNEDRRPTYPQDNPAYRAARRISMKVVPLMIRAMGRREFPPPSERGTPKKPRLGRPFTEISDVIFATAYRVLLNCSGPLAQAIVDDAWARGLLYRRPMLHARPPSIEALTTSLAYDRTYRALQHLIEVSNEPFVGTQDTIAVDGSEFEIHTRQHHAHKTNTRIRAAVTIDPDESAESSPPADYDERALAQLRLRTVKLHAAISPKTHMVVAAEVTLGKDHDSTQIFNLLEKSQRTRFIMRLLADAAYPSAKLFAYCKQHNIECIVPPRSNFLKDDQPKDTEDQRIMREYVRNWMTRSDDEKWKYGERQAAEGGFARIKRLTSSDLRSRTFEAQRAELLLNVLVANAMRLVYLYVAGEIAEIKWLDDRCRSILNEARDAVKHRPPVDRSPRYRDGLEDALNASTKTARASRNGTTTRRAPPSAPSA